MSESIPRRELVEEAGLDERKNIWFHTGTEEACAPLIQADRKKSFADWLRALVLTELRDRNPEAYKAMKGVA